MLNRIYPSTMVPTYGSGRIKRYDICPLLRNARRAGRKPLNQQDLDDPRPRRDISVDWHEPNSTHGVPPVTCSAQVAPLAQTGACQPVAYCKRKRQGGPVDHVRILK